MEYYRSLHLEKEPFSNSPDPGLFFNSRQHRDALQKLEISIRLRRGLNVITGDVGTGKTTVCRQLIRKIAHDDTIRYFLILDPGFSSAREFLACILEHFTGKAPEKEENSSEIQLKEKIKTYLFSKGVDEDTTTVLMIDEGQKLPQFCLETLRELLNYETNNKKLLQIIIFAQKEFDPMIAGMENFVDRINFRYAFSPLGFRETKALIEYRIEQSAQPGAFAEKRLPRFSFPAFWAVYRLTRGFPRKIINLCHHVVLAMIIRNKSTAGYFFVHSCAKEVFPGRRRPAISFVSLAFCVGILGAAAYFKADLARIIPWSVNQAAQITAAKNNTAAVMPPLPEINLKPVSQEEKQVTPAVSQPPVQVLVSAPKPVPAPVIAPVVDPAPEAAAPGTLGSIRIPKDETLYNMIATVYGSFNRQYLDRVIRENKNIRNPDLILHGIFIDFPVIKETQSRWKKEKACLVLPVTAEFESAYKMAKKYRDKGLDTRILSAWDEPDGFLFAVVVDRVFSSLEQARIYNKNHRTKTGRFEAQHLAALIQDRIIL